MPSLTVRLGRSRVGSFRACGSVGAAAAFALVVAATLVRSADLAVPLLVTAASVGAFLIGVKVTVILFGRERIVFYEQALPALGASALAMCTAGRPLGDGLDLAALGIFAFLACGRVGCYSVGCCHGRPWRRGVRYETHHALAGFPAALVAVPLFPIQLVESVLSLALVVAGTAWSLARHRPGDIGAGLLCGYGIVRTLLELARGDDARPLLRGLSEAQWTALGLSWVLVWLSRGGALSFPSAYLLAAVTLTAIDFALLTSQPMLLWSRIGLTRADHLAELADNLRTALAASGMQIFVTVYGLRVSVSVEGDLRHFGLSRVDRPLTPAEASRVADLIGLLVRARETTLRAGTTDGVYHLLAH